MIALIPVRHGVLPAGADEAIAECGGVAVLAGSGLEELHLDGLAAVAHLVELGDVEIGRWCAVLPAVLADVNARENDGQSTSIVLPNSPDGRDLAPRLAAVLGLPLFAGATTASPAMVRVARRGGLELHEHHPVSPFVATLQPGVRGAERLTDAVEIVRHRAPGSPEVDAPTDVVVVEVLPPDVRTMDLGEARRIVGGGAGLDAEQRFVELDSFAAHIGGVMGATRVITDRGWVHHDRQIGTTGVVVDPTLYISFGVSGAVQHVSGLGSPDHVISVNTDPHCPMMAMSDLAIVSDANATLDALLDAMVEGLPDRHVSAAAPGGGGPS
jgi:electron transfer flavoprotein alpha subunit